MELNNVQKPLSPRRKTASQELSHNSLGQEMTTQAVQMSMSNFSSVKMTCPNRIFSRPASWF
jgi:hypothetical protein